MKTNSVKLEFGFGAGLDRLQVPISQVTLTVGLDEIKATAIRMWGAYTLTLTTGGWTNDAGILSEELGYTLTIITTETAHVQSMVAIIKGALRQEAVAFTQTAVNFQII